MIYGPNVLSTAAASWQITNGSATASSLTLLAGGYASQSITSLGAIPEFMMLSLVASAYGDNYAKTVYAEVIYLTSAGVKHTYTIPVVDTGNGVCIVEFPTVEVDHIALVFKLVTDRDVTFTNIALFTPKLSDVDLTEILDRLPNLLSDVNTSPITVTQEEDLVALISAYITEDTELLGNFNLGYVAAAPTELVIRIKDNEVTELHTPLVYTLPAGRGVIGLPHGYLGRLAGYHNFTVTAQVLSGSIAIDTRKMLYVIDGARLAYNIMDIGSTAYDVTVRKLVEELEVSYIYAICIDDGVCTVKKSEYSSTPGSAWIAEATVGPAIDAAIEFEGVWDFSVNPYVFDTTADPWTGWVTPEGDLYVKPLYAIVAPLLLATGVSCVSVVRGWENTLELGQDHGLIFAYIKSGVPYYRTRAMQVYGERVWETEVELTVFTGTAVEINAFRTNDYRVGINIMDDLGVTHTYLTPRNWGGLASPVEHIDTSLEVTFGVLPVDYIDTEDTEQLTTDLDIWFNVAEPIYPVPVEASNDDEYTIRLLFSHEVDIDLSTVASAFMIKDSINVTFPIASTSAGTDNTELVFTMENFNAASGDMTITYDRTVLALDCLNQGSRFAIEPFGFVFTPDLVPPEGHEVEQLAVALVSTFNVTQVYYTGAYEDENLTAAPIVTFVVTQVGTNPL